MSNEIKLSFLENNIMALIRRYKPKKYWRYRNDVISCTSNTLVNRLRTYYKLLYIKRADAFNNSTFGTHVGFGAKFSSTPILPHGINGIVVTHNATIGTNCTIYHQVTIGQGNGGAPVIGNDVMIGAGAKIVGGISIGNNVNVGANCCVYTDVPDNSTVVMGKSRIISRV